MEIDILTGSILYRAISHERYSDFLGQLVSKAGSVKTEKHLLRLHCVQTENRLRDALFSIRLKRSNILQHRHHGRPRSTSKIHCSIRLNEVKQLRAPSSSDREAQSKIHCSIRLKRSNTC